MSGAHDLNTLYPGRWRSLLFPLHGKVPAEKGVDWLATALERYEFGSKLGPGYFVDRNVGLVIPPGLLVLDADSPEASIWLAHWLPDSATYPQQRTRQGRCHFWVRLPDPDLFEKQTSFRNSAGVKIDIRLGGKGYVVVAPSIHPETGHPYRWTDGFSLPPDPDDVPRLDATRCKQILDAQAEYRADGTVPLPPGIAVEAEFGLTVILEGERNQFLFGRACAIVANANPESLGELFGAVMARNLEDCQPPLSEAEVRLLCDGAWKHNTRLPIDPVTGQPEPPGTLCSDVKPEPVDWLWTHHIAAGALTVFDGDGGIGKSVLLLDLAARVTTGAAWPDGTPGGEPAGVVVCSGEDELANTVVPRLIAAGADLTRVRDLRFPDIKSLADTTIVEATARDVGARLVIFDPLMDYLVDLDVHRDNEVRGALHAMKELSRRMRFGFVVSRHLSKGAAGGSAAHAGIGSVGITNTARCVFLVTEDPDVSGGGRVSLSKGNLSPPAMRRVSREFEIRESDGWEGALRVVWGSQIELDANDCLQESRELTRSKKRGRPPIASAAAAGWLGGLLQDGPVPSGLVEESRIEHHYSLDAFKRAKKQLEAVSFKEGKAWWIRLPEHAEKALSESDSPKDKG